MKILLASSSSGGHIFPIMSLYEQLKKENKVTLLGIINQMEEKYYPLFDAIYLNIKNSFKKNFNYKNFPSFIKEIRRVKTLVKDYDVFISGGGISSLILTLIKGDKPLYLLEQNVILGDSNKFAYYFAKNIFVSFPLANKFYKRKIIEVGNPSVSRLKISNQTKEKLIIFIFGSLSSKTLIEKTLKFFYSSLFEKSYSYLLIVGSQIQYLKQHNLPKNVHLKEKINPGDYFKKASLIFTRAGGSTIYELLHLEASFVLVPSPYVKHHHQEKNALYLHSEYGIPIIKEEDYNSLTIRNAVDRISFYKYKRKPLLYTSPSQNIIEKIYEDNLK